MGDADERKNSAWRRHLDGWRAGLLVVVLAVYATSLAMPRPTTPFVVPIPSHDTARGTATDKVEVQRARQARIDPLPHETRLIGEGVRRLGIALAADPARAEPLRRKLRRDVKDLIAAGQTNSLLLLRALQAELFVEAVRAWEHTGEVSEELRELGSDFAQHAATAWRATGSSGRPAPLLLSDDQLRLLYRVRWGTLTGVHRVHPFGPSLNEFRHYYATLLTYPEGESPQDRILNQLASVQALGRIDSTYPASFARGVLLSRLGDSSAAAQAFEGYLRAHPDGPWTLLARNHWLTTRSALGEHPSLLR